MATVEERMRVLRLIEEGKVTAEEGARLLAALDKSRHRGGRSRRSAPANGGSSGRWMRLRVVDQESGKTKVNMTLPLGLINMGLSVGARFVPDMASMDVEEIRAALESGRPGKILEVTGDSGELVEIFVE